jgi:hypothetical protein
VRKTVIVASAALLAACGSQNDSAAQTLTDAPGRTLDSGTVPRHMPDLAACPERAPVQEGLRERREPITVPPALGEVMRANMDNFAIATIDGATVCIDASWMEAISNPTISGDGRFAAFDWDGYEAFGHVIVDRKGKGRAIDTGVPPSTSPSGKLLAAADLGEAGFGALNAFAVWRIEPASVRQVGKQDEVPPAYDWRVESWAGETCVDLSAVPWDDDSAEATGQRAPYHAREGGGWKLEQGRCGDA